MKNIQEDNIWDSLKRMQEDTSNFQLDYTQEDARGHI